MKRNTVLAILVFLLFSCTAKQPLPDLDPVLKTELLNYLKHNHLSPEDYLISKFENHDIVFLGEVHKIKHHVEFVQNMIPLLYKNRIFTLATEFARREDQSLIDSLLNNPVYDNELAKRITFLQSVHWGYKEYCDIFKSAWELNQNLPAGNRKLRILALNDSPDWSVLQKRADRNNDDLKRKVWRGGGEKFWAQILLDEIISNGEKALVHSGIHHAFTEYKQPIYNFKDKQFLRFETTRMGNFVYDKIGKRAITIFLHTPWNSAKGWNEPLVYPVDGAIDVLINELPVESQRAGFDTRGTPFEKLTSTTSLYKFGYEEFNLSQYCDGYIIQKPFSEYEGVTPIEGFIDEKNISYARSQSPDPRFRNASISKFQKSIKKSSNIRKKFSHLH